MQGTAHTALLTFPFPCTQPLPADAAGESAVKPGDNNRDPKAKMCSQGFCSAPAAQVTWAQRAPGILVNGNLHLWCQICFSALWRVSLKLAWNGTKLHHHYPPCIKERNVFLDYNTDQGNSNGLLHKAYPFTIHLYKPRTASTLFITWLHSSSIAGNHYHSMITKNNI